METDKMHLHQWYIYHNRHKGLGTSIVSKPFQRKVLTLACLLCRPVMHSWHTSKRCFQMVTTCDLTENAARRWAVRTCNDPKSSSIGHEISKAVSPCV
eukprot:350047-Amphidinium_carterae.1